MIPTILITRPEPANAQFADQLRARLGCDVPLCLAPIMQIEFGGTLPDLSTFKGLLFTSRNGVRAFAAQTQRRDLPCVCVGDATARAARGEGLSATSCDGAAEDLIQHLLTQNAEGPFLHIRGEFAQGDIATRLSQAGVPTSEAVLYRQVPKALSTEARKLLGGENPVILPLFSPRSADLLSRTEGATAEIWVAAISENVSSALPMGFAKRVLVAERPNAAAMLDAVQALVDSGKALEGGKLAQ